MPTPPKLGASDRLLSRELRGADAALLLALSADGRRNAPETAPKAAFKDATAAAMIRLGQIDRQLRRV